jgi:hypothetical protein
MTDGDSDPGPDRRRFLTVWLPHRPRPDDPVARRLIERAEALYYIFWLALSAVTAALVLASYGPSLLK